jgi:diguanylate cyclase (GGDEF)-like protein
MGKLGAALRASSPHSLLRIYLAVVVCAAALAVGAVLWTTSVVDKRTQEAASLSNAATSASQIQAGLREPLLALMVNSYSFLLSNDDLAELPETQREQVMQVIAASFMDPNRVFPLPDDLSLSLSDRDAVSVHRSIDLYLGQIDELVAGADGIYGIDLTPVEEERERLTAALEAYFEEESMANFASLFTSVIALGSSLDATQDRLSIGVTDAQMAVNEATSRARAVMVVTLFLLTAMMGASTFFVGRLISRAFHSSEQERKALQETTETLIYRNEQLNGLYAVFSEITDTLSMRYVIGATLRETQRVMNASLVVLRLMQDGDLVVAGSLTADGKEIPNMPAVLLGDGPTGRVARRGRSMRIDHDAQEVVNGAPLPGDLDKTLESGIIVPLIIGARVVGTLAVWADKQKAFTDDDQRVLEMMASQVATAVVAADNADLNERRALRDPLTGLPNRRQLTADIANQYEKLETGRTAAVAMIDVDKFKTVNDEYGHRVGDISLQKIASILRNAMRDGDMIYRYGGEEFVAIFKGASGQDALSAAERLRMAVETTPITGDLLETVSPITISIGLALMPDHGSDINELIEKADRAMYQAKDSGRNRVQVWQEDALDVTEVA